MTRGSRSSDRQHQSAQIQFDSMCSIVPYHVSQCDGIIAMVQEVYREYGWTWEAHGYHRDLYDIEGVYLDQGGMYWVLVEGDRIVGCAGVTVHDRERPAHDPQGAGPLERDGDLKTAELHRLYLLSSVRGKGWGYRLLNETVSFARGKGCRRMIAWSDFVLKEAHGLYVRNGFVQEGRRMCDDPDHSKEHGFWKEPL